MAAGGVGNLVFKGRGTMNKDNYRKILGGNLAPSVEKKSLGKFWGFQQDNHLKHPAKQVKDWLLFCFYFLFLASNNSYHLSEVSLNIIRYYQLNIY